MSRDITHVQWRLHWSGTLEPNTHVSRKQLQIHTWSQWNTYRKWLLGNQMVTWPMTSRDLERSRSWPNYVWGVMSGNVPFLFWTTVLEVGPWDYAPSIFYIFEPGVVHGPERQLRIMPSVSVVGSMFCTSCHSWSFLIQVHSETRIELRQSRKDCTWASSEALMMIHW